MLTSPRVRLRRGGGGSFVGACPFVAACTNRGYLGEGGSDISPSMKVLSSSAFILISNSGSGIEVEEELVDASVLLGFEVFFTLSSHTLADSSFTRRS